MVRRHDCCPYLKVQMDDVDSMAAHTRAASDFTDSEGIDLLLCYGLRSRIYLRPVALAFEEIDALDSKRKDLKADLAVLCLRPLIHSSQCLKPILFHSRLRTVLPLACENSLGP